MPWLDIDDISSMSETSEPGASSDSEIDQPPKGPAIEVAGEVRGPPTHRAEIKPIWDQDACDAHSRCRSRSRSRGAITSTVGAKPKAQNQVKVEPKLSKFTLSVQVKLVKSIERWQKPLLDFLQPYRTERCVYGLCGEFSHESLGVGIGSDFMIFQARLY